MFSTQKAFARIQLLKFFCFMNPVSLLITSTGRGSQFSRTPSMIKTSFFSLLYVNVNGNGPAKRLASFHSIKGEPGGSGTFLPNFTSTFNCDFSEEIDSVLSLFATATSVAE